MFVLACCNPCKEYLKRFRDDDRRVPTADEVIPIEIDIPQCRNTIMREQLLWPGHVQPAAMDGVVITAMKVQRDIATSTGRHMEANVMRPISISTLPSNRVIHTEMWARTRADASL